MKVEPIGATKAFSAPNLISSLNMVAFIKHISHIGDKRRIISARRVSSNFQSRRSDIKRYIFIAIRYKIIRTADFLAVNYTRFNIETAINPRRFPGSRTTPSDPSRAKAAARRAFAYNSRAKEERTWLSPEERKRGIDRSAECR